MEQMLTISSNKLYQHTNLVDNLIETIYKIVFKICLFWLRLAALAKQGRFD
jgi:hypothetical protein